MFTPFENKKNCATSNNTWRNIFQYFVITSHYSQDQIRKDKTEQHIRIKVFFFIVFILNLNTQSETNKQKS